MWIQRTSNLLWSKFTLDSAWWEIYASGADSSSWEGVCLHSTLLNGTGVVLGLAPALEYTFLKHVSPVGAYFKVLCPSIVDHLLDILCHPGSFFFLYVAFGYAPMIVWCHFIIIYQNYLKMSLFWPYFDLFVAGRISSNWFESWHIFPLCCSWWDWSCKSIANHAPVSLLLLYPPV